MSAPPPESPDGPSRPSGSHPWSSSNSGESSGQPGPPSPDQGAPEFPSQVGPPKGSYAPQPGPPPQASYPPQAGQPPQGGYPPYASQAPQSGYGQPYGPPQSGPHPGYPPPVDPGRRYPPQPYGQAPMAGPLSVSDEKLWSTLSHISIPFVGFLGPLIVYLAFRERGPFVRAHAIESLNFSILYSIAQVACVVLSVVGIGAILLPLVGIAALVLCILAALAANRGELYAYPVNWRLVTE